ncbi:hypothetical protein F8A86_11655 [Betaproteobacteria bacterium SCN1]|jgi:hypothetical protein|nr:hypothetical protein F8A86_11655 [Betaproteobacteria bacterium SCN1]
MLNKPMFWMAFGFYGGLVDAVTGVCLHIMSRQDFTQFVLWHTAIAVIALSVGILALRLHRGNQTSTEKGNERTEND